MKSKDLLSYLPSFFIFLFSLAISSNFILNYQKNSIQNSVFQAIEKKLLDYQNVFFILKSKILFADDTRFLSPYVQQQIYLNEKTEVVLGEIECKFIHLLNGSELSGWHSPNKDLEKKLFSTKGVSVVTPAYYSSQITEDLLVDIGYGFELDGYNGYLKTTILLRNLLSYVSSSLFFVGQENKRSHSFFSKIFYHPDLKVYIGVDVPSTFLLAYILLYVLLYSVVIVLWKLFWLSKKNLLLKQEISLSAEALKQLEQERNFFDSLNIGKMIEIKKTSCKPSLVCLTKLIEEILEFHEKTAKEKSITFDVQKENSPSLIISTKKGALFVFLNLYIQHLIQENLPNTTISCSISAEDQSNDYFIAKIVFKDERTFSSKIDSVFFTTHVSFPSSIKVPINHLLKEIGAFVNSSMNSETGSKTIIAIPFLNKEGKPKTNSNIIPFHR